MKHLILLLLVSAFGYGQKLTADERTILEMELVQHGKNSPNQAYTKSVIGDSIINKYTSAVTIKKSEKIGLGTFSILSISKPIISRDGKYGIIETAHEHYGGVLNIYKKRDNKWELYKTIQLYII
jgi:hypothetical protein